MAQSLQLNNKIQKNIELLRMYRKLHQLEESCWGKFFRFEKSTTFIQFQKKYSIPGVLRFRIDDGIYLILLTIIVTVFCILPSQTDHLLTRAFRQGLIFYELGSIIWLITSHWYKHLIYFIFCIIFPLLIFLVYFNIIVLDPINSKTEVDSYLGLLSLWGIWLLLYCVYPLKEFIRTKIGSLYSFLYSLSFATLFAIWPAYSLLEEYIKNSSITFQFVTNNQPLIITFLIIIVFSFHLFTHNSQFEGNIKAIKKSLYLDFTKTQLLKAIEHIQEEEQSCFYRNFNIYTRIMSLVVFLATLAVVIFTFIYLASNIATIYKSVGIMVFSVIFLVYGTIINLFTSSRALVLLIFSIVSLIPACFSPLYYSRQFFQYIFLGLFLPYSTIFWCIVRSLSQRRPILKINVLVILFMFLHIPIMIFIMNSFQMLTTDTQTIQIINYCIFGMIGLSCLVGLSGFIIWLCLSVKELPKQETLVDKTIDYNYYEEGNPPYIPYKTEESFSLAWLGSLDIKNMGELFSSVSFICCELATFYFYNELDNKYSAKIWNNNTNIVDIINSQFFISFIFFIYSYAYILISPTSFLSILLIIIFFLLGIIGVTLSYTISGIQFLFALRLCGAFCFGLALIAISFALIKHKNPKVSNFLCSVLIMLSWVVLIIPYAIAVPIVAIYFEDNNFYSFVYVVILITVTLMILLVSAISIIFNILMNKFEQEKKVKFMIDDVQTYLKDEGVETEDEVMHVLYESFQNRDKKYVYFLKKGFPVRIWKDPSNFNTYKTIVYNQEDLLKEGTLSKIDQGEEDYCWKCLTCCCGKDEQQMEGNVAKAYNTNMVNEEELQSLFPKMYLKGILKNTIQSGEEERLKDPSQVYSTKSLILRNMNKIGRNLGDQYTLLKSKKNKKIVIEIWHQVFDFISNNDDPPQKVIFNDFLLFCRASELGLSDQEVNNIYRKISNTNWNQYISMNIGEFALAVQALAKQIYGEKYGENVNSSVMLVEKVFYNLCQYSEFQDVLHSKQFKRKSVDLSNSSFQNCYQAYLQFDEEYRLKNEQYNKKVREYQQTKLIEPGVEEQRERVEKVEVQEKTESCKRIIYNKYLALKNCCKEEDNDETVIKRKNVKPWDFLALEVTRILERKENQWKEKSHNQQYLFRPIFNNFLVAVFKFSDLYIYLQVTLMNKNIPWQDLRTIDVLLLDYRIQLYIAFGLVAVCLVLGIKGIGYIFEDRLGLTETRIPAAFPHPMFFFTVFYKLLVLAGFNTIIMTLLSTFACDWVSSTNPQVIPIKENQLICFSTEHNLYLMFSLVLLLLYYPLSTYTMPNFQFAEKRLDVKYKPSYLIIYFQVSFVLAAGKVLLYTIEEQASQTEVSTLDIVFISINIFCLVILLICILSMQPCLISWFNYVQFLTVWIGLVWNVFGFILLFYNTLQVVCYAVAGGITLVSIIVCIIIVKYKYFSNNKVHVEADNDEIEELEQGWEYKKEIGVNLIKYDDQQSQNERQIKTRLGSNKIIQHIEVEQVSN